MPARFCPSPGSYAVIRIDPVAMVEHLHDQVAHDAAASMRVKSYLAYIGPDLSLPFPGKPWYSFSISLLATTLREPDEGRGITAEMCIPIAPNDRHPLGREALQTAPPFPFSHCYHWLSMQTDVRVRARAEGFDSDKAIKLPPSERVKMNCYWNMDFTQCRSTQLEREQILSQLKEAASSCQPDPVMAPAEDALQTASASPSVPLDRGEGAVPQALAGIAEDLEHHSDGSGSDISSIRSTVSAHSADGIMSLGVFGHPSNDPELLPLVDLWLDLTEHIAAEEIPDPAGFLEERDQVARIIQEARARDPTLPQLDLSAFGPPPVKSEESISSDGRASSDASSYSGSEDEGEEEDGRPETRKPRSERG